MLLTLLFSCSTPTPNSPLTTDFSITTYQSPELGDAFGFAVAAGEQVLVGAPEGDLGRAYNLQKETIELIFEENSFGAAGHAVAYGPDGEVLIGAPLAENGLGSVYQDGAVLREGLGALGARIQPTNSGTVLSESQGFWVNNERTELPHRFSSVALWNGTWTVGMAYAEDALWTPGNTLARNHLDDLAGYSICSANFDEDPEAELAVGAPGAGLVYLLNPGDTLATAQTIGPGTGRFGHALACRDNLLLVGAPTYGENLSGAVWCFRGPMSTWKLNGPLHVGGHWQQTGFSVTVSEKIMAVGSPGSAAVRGEVTTWTR